MISYLTIFAIRTIFTGPGNTPCIDWIMTSQLPRAGRGGTCITIKSHSCPFKTYLGEALIKTFWISSTR